MDTNLTARLPGNRPDGLQQDPVGYADRPGDRNASPWGGRWPERADGWNLPAGLEDSPPSPLSPSYEEEMDLQAAKGRHPSALPPLDDSPGAARQAALDRMAVHAPTDLTLALWDEDGDLDEWKYEGHSLVDVAGDLLGLWDDYPTAVRALVWHRSDGCEHVAEWRRPQGPVSHLPFPEGAVEWLAEVGVRNARRAWEEVETA